MNDDEEQFMSPLEATSVGAAILEVERKNGYMNPASPQEPRKRTGPPKGILICKKCGHSLYLHGVKGEENLGCSLCKDKGRSCTETFTNTEIQKASSFKFPQKGRQHRANKSVKPSEPKPEYTCRKCNYSWQPRKPSTPKVCPHCYSMNWRTGINKRGRPAKAKKDLKPTAQKVSIKLPNSPKILLQQLRAIYDSTVLEPLIADLKKRHDEGFSTWLDEQLKGLK